MKQDEISSTERLLDLIRDKRDTEPGSPDISPPRPFVVVTKPSIKTTLAFRKTVTVGVDIGNSDIRLVAINQHSDKKQELVKYSKIPFDPDMSRDGLDFSRFLKSSLRDFVVGLDRIEVWCAISSANVETRYLRIPKVPKKQIATAVYWTHKKEVAFNEKSQIFDFEILGDVIEDGIQKTEVMSYTAPKEEVEGLQRLFSKTGYPLTGISIVPFALQNLFRTRCIETDEKNVCTFFIGRDWTRIAIFSAGNLILSRGVKSGVISMVEAVREQLSEIEARRSAEQADPGDPSKTADLADHIHVQTDQAQKIFDHFIKGTPPLAGEDAGLHLDEASVFAMALPALERVVRQVERTIEHYYLNFGNESVGKIYISGLISTQHRMIEYIAEQLNLSIETVDPFLKILPASGKITAPESKTEREQFVSAVGMALSSNSMTPNFIFTHKNKEKFSRIRLIDRLIIMTFLVLFVIAIGVSFWQNTQLDRKEARLDGLRRQMDNYSPLVNQDLILKAVAQTNEKMHALKEFSNKYKSMAIIKTVSDMTPPNIRLLSISADFGKPSEEASDSKKNILVLDGIVLKGDVPYEAVLAGFIVKLKNSPLFGQSSVNRRSFEFIENQEVLRFTAQLELV
ncbi:MAG: pilus assembly protein PilM [Pseudomonadota bacterium]